MYPGPSPFPPPKSQGAAIEKKDSTDELGRPHPDMS